MWTRICRTNTQIYAIVFYETQIEATDMCEITSIKRLSYTEHCDVFFRQGENEEKNLDGADCVYLCIRSR